MGVCGGVVSPSQPRPWRLRPSISEVQRRHLVGDGKLRGRNMCEPGWGGGTWPLLMSDRSHPGPQAPPPRPPQVTGRTRE